MNNWFLKFPFRLVRSITPNIIQCCLSRLSRPSRFTITVLIALLCWTVQARAIRTIDGDSFVIRAEIWPKLYKIETVRLLGVDAPELRGPDRDKALAAKAFTEEWLSRGPFTVEACGRDSFGRLLAHVSRDGEALAGALTTTEHARVRLAR